MALFFLFLHISPLLYIKMVGQTLKGLFQDETAHPGAVSDWSCTYTWYWVIVAGSQQDIPSEQEEW